MIEIDLPACARDKLAGFAQELADARALSARARESFQEREMIAGQMRGQVQDEKSHRRYADAVATMERARTLWDNRHQVVNVLEQLQARLRDWLHAQLESVQFEAAPTANVEIDGDPRQHVERVRSQIMANGMRMRDIQIAPSPHDDALKQLRAFVDHMAARGAPFAQMIEGRITLPIWEGTVIGGAPARISDIVAYNAWRDPDALFDRLVADVIPRFVPENGGGLPLDERKAAIAKLDAETMVLCREEEAIIEQAAQSGIVIARRYDAPPLAILGIQVATSRRPMLQAAE